VLYILLYSTSKQLILILDRSLFPLRLHHPRRRASHDRPLDVLPPLSLLKLPPHTHRDRSKSPSTAISIPFFIVPFSPRPFQMHRLSCPPLLLSSSSSSSPASYNPSSRSSRTSAHISSCLTPTSFGIFLYPSPGMPNLLLARPSIRMSRPRLSPPILLQSKIQTSYLIRRGHRSGVGTWRSRPGFGETRHSEEEAA
jgi:hypothetical protein